MKQTTHHFTTIIIGGGLSGLTVAHRLRNSAPDHRLLVMEKSDRIGGAIRSHNDQGYLAEIGPHGFLDNCEESKTILYETGLDKECVKAPLSRFVRYVCLNGKLLLIPQSPPKNHQGTADFMAGQVQSSWRSFQKAATR